MKRIGRADTLSALVVVLWAGVLPAEVLIDEDFEAAQPGAPMAAAGWTQAQGRITISDSKTFAGHAIDPTGTQEGVVSIAYKALPKPPGRQKTVMTFQAHAYPGSHNSSVGLAAVLPDGGLKQLVGWCYADRHWQFDARGITRRQPGQSQRIQRVWAGGVDETVTGAVVVDAGGHWVYGSITDRSGKRHKSRVFELPASNERLTAAVCINQDARAGSGPIGVDDIRVTRRPIPPIVGGAHRPRLPLTIVELGWTSPDTKYLHDNIAEMERRPLDGVTVRVADPRFPHGNLLYGIGRGEAGWKVFQNERLARRIIVPAIDDLETTGFKRFNSNFVAMVTYLPDRKTMDWFDDDWWANIAHNAGLLAEVAKKGGCKGIMFDPEEYGCRLWSSRSLRKDPLYEGKTHEQVVAKVRQRGREFMRAVNASYPGVHILSLHAWEDALSNFADDAERRANTDGRGLVVTFLDGMLEASDEGTIIIDGIENGYYIEERIDFRTKVDRVLRYGPRISAVPDDFRDKVRTGFGVWVDRNRRWDPLHVAKNFWTPEKLRKVVANALITSDGFVWIYTERVTFWLDSPDARLGGGIDLGTGVGDYAYRNQQIKWMPRAYWHAIENGRRDALEARKRMPSAPPAKEKKRPR